MINTPNDAHMGAAFSVCVTSQRDMLLPTETVSKIAGLLQSPQIEPAASVFTDFPITSDYKLSDYVEQQTKEFSLLGSTA